ncbi:MAG TPA: hypothetical protein VFS21_26205 [Roseiflexaceae bacterium]|nr:hypothetical protein [Roseiflexaceae bacterium]
MRTTNLTRRSPLPADIFLLRRQNKGFIEGRFKRFHSTFTSVLLLPVTAALSGLLMLHEAIDLWSEGPIFSVLDGLLGAIFLLGGLVLLVHTVREHWQLHREGWLLAGKVVSADIHRYASGNHKLVLDYCFTAPGGQVITKQTWIGLRRITSGPLTEPPRPGTPLAILYLSPESHELL